MIAICISGHPFCEVLSPIYLVVQMVILSTYISQMMTDLRSTYSDKWVPSKVEGVTRTTGYISGPQPTIHADQTKQIISSVDLYCIIDVELCWALAILLSIAYLLPSNTRVESRGQEIAVTQ